ncbi:MAG: hypothetical protein ACE5DS_05885 [Kiloniellaceae bacterium]
MVDPRGTPAATLVEPPRWWIGGWHKRQRAAIADQGRARAPGRFNFFNAFPLDGGLAEA